MFVFGEVQDPNMDTVNLVEDIVRSQLIELVSLLSETSIITQLFWLRRSCKRELLQRDVVHGICPPRTLYF